MSQAFKVFFVMAIVFVFIPIGCISLMQSKIEESTTNLENIQTSEMAKIKLAVMNVLKKGL